MSKLPDVLWLNTSPSLQYFAQPLLRYLSDLVIIQEWKYRQSQDEVSSLDAAVVLLHDYLKSCNRPVHLIGHSTGGLLGLLYSRRYPETVKSLTLLAVGVDAAVDWQAHYYMHRQFLSRQKLLTDMVYNLFGYQDKRTLKSLTHLLEQDLDCSLSPHSLFERVSIKANKVAVPLMVCGSLNDIIVEPEALQGWRSPLVLFRRRAFLSLFPLSACSRTATRLLEVYPGIRFAVFLFATLGINIMIIHLKNDLLSKTNVRG